MNLKLTVTAASLAASLLAFTALPALADNPFADVPANSWSYDAISQLAADGIIEGYPDKTFKGNRPLTRYEAAVLTERAVKKLEAELADVKTAGGVQQKDLDAVKKLLDEYGTDIKGLQTDVAQLKADDASTKKLLDRQQFHLYYFLRAPGIFNQQLTAHDAVTGLTLPNGARVTYGSNPGQNGQNLQFTGTNDHGTGYQVLRMVFRGNVDEHVSYGVRLEDRYCFDAATTNGSTCASQTGNNSLSSITPFQSAYPANGLLRINYAFAKYTDKGSGLDLTGGRYIYGEGPDDLGLNYADYFNGAVVHFKKMGADFSVGYGTNQAANSNTGSGEGKTQNTLLGSASYTVAKKYNVGVSYINDSNWPGQLFWNPFSSTFVATSPTSIATGSGWFQATFNPNLKLEFEALHRFGIDPETGVKWSQPDAYWAQLNVGDTVGHKGNNYLDLGGIDTGFNSTGPHTNIAGTTGYQQFYLSEPNGFRVYYAGIHHWFGDNARIGLIYQHYGIKPGTDQPATYTLPGSTVALPGFVSGDNRNALVLETLLSF